MTNRNFEDIDQLFREGLNPEEDPVTFNEADWLKLQQRLDRNEKKKKGIFWISRLSGVAALILLLFALWMLLPEGRNQVIQQAEVQQKDEKIKKEQNQTAASHQAEQTVRNSESGSSKMLAQNKQLKEKVHENLATANTIEKKTSGNVTLGEENRSVSIKAPTVNSKEYNPSQPDRMKSPDEKRTFTADTAGVENFSVQKATTEPKVNSKEPKSAQTEIVKSPEQKPPSADESLYAAIEEPNENPIVERPVRKMALSILAAPDYNGVNNMNNPSMGNDFGLLLSYEFARNWSFSTGGIYAKKLYETGFRNYNPTKNIWTEYYPKSVSADCRVLDIPLNISYTFLKRKNNTISAGSGISSYIMLKENYQFTYTQTDGNNPLAYQVVNQNQHWLGVLNLQATFDQKLSSRLSISLQPFMKIPLRDIGFAGVKLQSFGMAANLSWNFNL